MSRHTLRVLTLNCWNVSEPLAERMAMIRDGIEALQPDLIGLQEIVVRRDGFDQGAIILKDLGYECRFGPAFRWNDEGVLLPLHHDGEAFGNLIASRFPIRRSEVQELPGAETEERRSALTTLVETPWGIVPFVNTHLNWKLHHGAIRERQAVALADIVRARMRDGTLPPIVVGDLNAEPDSTEVRFLCGLTSLDGRSIYFQDAWRVAGDGSPGFTWDNRNHYAAYSFEPCRRIDYILIGLPDLHGRGWIETVRLAFTRPKGEVFASDHFGLVAEVRV